MHLYIMHFSVGLSFLILRKWGLKELFFKEISNFYVRKQSHLKEQLSEDNQWI